MLTSQRSASSGLVAALSFSGDGNASRLPGDLHDGLVAWHCATSCISTDEGGEVAAWADISGNGCSLRARAGAKCPTYKSCAIAGSPAIEFAKGQVLVASTECDVQTIALVVQCRSLCDYMMLISQVRLVSVVLLLG